MKSERIRLFYSIFLSALTVITALTFIVQVADIYYGGPNANHLHNYSAETVKEHLVLPTVFLCIWIASIIGGFVLSVVYPTKTKSKVMKNQKKAFTGLLAMMPDDDSDEIKEIKQKILSTERLRLVFFCLTSVFCLTVAVLTLTYTLDPSHYSTNEFLEDMLAFLREILVYIAVAFVVVCLYMLSEKLLINKEMDYVKKAIALKGKGPGFEPKNARPLSLYIIIPAVALVFILISAIMKVAVAELILYAAVAALLELICLFVEILRRRTPRSSEHSNVALLVTRLAVGVVAIVFIVLGAVNGGASDVLIKAIKICTECIGLG